MGLVKRIKKYVKKKIKDREARKNQYKGSLNDIIIDTKHLYIPKKEGTMINGIFRITG